MSLSGMPGERWRSGRGCADVFSLGSVAVDGVAVCAATGRSAASTGGGDAAIAIAGGWITGVHWRPSNQRNGACCHGSAYQPAADVTAEVHVTPSNHRSGAAADGSAYHPAGAPAATLPPLATVEVTVREYQTPHRHIHV
ncbi:hypothetical protein GCM10009722_15970 [Williamsia deligens]